MLDWTSLSAMAWLLVGGWVLTAHIMTCFYLGSLNAHDTERI